MDEYESNFVSAVVAPGEIGVKFNDVGALEDVKKALNELVILPMRRPELFSRGNLLRVLILHLICTILVSHFSVRDFVKPFPALQRNFALWTSWNWENPSCQSACNRGRGKLYQHNWFNSYFKGAIKNGCCIHLVRFRFQDEEFSHVSHSFTYNKRTAFINFFFSERVR
jgi:hypothetical protein